MYGNYKVRIHSKRVQRYFAGMARRTQSFSAQFRWARREVSRWNAENFASSGTASGAKWNALDREYHSWKIMTYGPLPTMVRTGDLYTDLITLRGGPNHIGHKRASFGTDLEYAEFHQTGTKFMPARKIVFTPTRLQEQLGNKIMNHLIFGSKGMRNYRRVKSIVFRGRHAVKSAL